MIKVKVVDAEVGWLGKLEIEGITNVVNEIGKEKILYITANSTFRANSTRYTIFYEDDD